MAEPLSLYDQETAHRRAGIALRAMVQPDPIPVSLTAHASPVATAILRMRTTPTRYIEAPTLPVLEPACMDRGS